MRARRQRALFIELLALETRRGQIQAELRGIYEADQTDHRNPPLSRDDGYWGKVPAPARLLEFDTGAPDAVKSRWPSVRFLLVTGWGAAMDPAEGRARGVEVVLAKPYQLTDLLQALARPEAAA